MALRGEGHRRWVLRHAGEPAVKKLKAVAAALLGAPGDGEQAPGLAPEAASDLAAYGATAEQVAALGLDVKGQNADRIVEVEPENCDAVRVFMRMATQWRRTSFSNGKYAAVIFTGLDYGALPIVAQTLGVALDEDALDRVCILEHESLRIRGGRLKQDFKGS